jgi:hypothetical protein
MKKIQKTTKNKSNTNKGNKSNKSNKSKKSGKKSSKTLSNRKNAKHIATNSKKPKLLLGDELKNSAELSKFRDTKSISIASRLTDIKETQVGELIDMKPVHDVMLNMCVDKMTKRKYTFPDSSVNKPIIKNLAKDVCECLFSKNKDLSVNELENRVVSHLETPGSSCIGILDNYYNKTKTHKKLNK